MIPQLPPPMAAHQEPIDAPTMKVAKQFEAVFINQLIGAMRNTVVKGGFVKESQGEKIYQSLLDFEYADQMSESGQLGLSNLIYQQLLPKK